MLELITQALPFILKVLCFAGLIHYLIELGYYLDEKRNIRIIKTSRDAGVLISMVRKFYPTMIAHELVGVQPMSNECGTVFKMQYTPGVMEELKNRLQKHYHVESDPTGEITEILKDSVTKKA